MKGLSYVVVEMVYVHLHTARVRTCAHDAIPANGIHIGTVMDHMETMSYRAEFWIEICAAKHIVKSRHGKSIVPVLIAMVYINLHTACARMCVCAMRFQSQWY